MEIMSVIAVGVLTGWMCTCQVLLIDMGGLLILFNRFMVLSDSHINMGRHMNEVACDLTATITEEEARKDRGKEIYLPTPIFSMIRFGRWDELLKEPVPPKGLRFMEKIGVGR